MKSSRIILACSVAEKAVICQLIISQAEYVGQHPIHRTFTVLHTLFAHSNLVCEDKDMCSYVTPDQPKKELENPSIKRTFTLTPPSLS